MLQQNYPNNYGKQSVGNIIKKIYAENGIKSLFKGNLTNCLRIVPQNAIQLSFYNYFEGIPLLLDNLNNPYTFFLLLG